MAASTDAYADDAGVLRCPSCFVAALGPGRRIWIRGRKPDEKSHCYPRRVVGAEYCVISRDLHILMDEAAVLITA